MIGVIFKNRGSTTVLVDDGSSHKTAEPPQIDVADISSIGITTFMSSDTELKGLCIRGPHVVTNLNRTE
jgi:hypothetical protein